MVDVAFVTIHFLLDENGPHAVREFLQSRGHRVDWVGEAFAKSSPDSLLLTSAEQWGFVVITWDRDFRQLIRQVPPGSKTQFQKRAGRLSLTCKENEAAKRLADMMDVVEFHYQRQQARGERFIMQISRTSYTFTG